MLAPVQRVWDLARPTRLLAHVSKLAVFSGAAGPCWGAKALHPAVSESLEVNQPARLHQPYVLELLAGLYVVKALRPYLLDKPFELQTNNASMQLRHVGHHQVPAGPISSAISCTSLAAQSRPTSRLMAISWRRCCKSPR